MNKELKSECMAIGSLPHKNLNDAMNLVKKNFPNIPFWPQLSKLNKNEDMTLQFLEKMPGLTYDSDLERYYINQESDIFFEQLEQFFMDYEEIISEINSPKLEDYGLTEKSSSTFKLFLEIIKTTAPKFAKGQIIGPFTLATSLTDKDNKCTFYDETLKEVLIKLLSLKALWQIKKIKDANSKTTPIIFIDEPSVSQLGTSAYITIPPVEVITIIKELSDLIKANGALSAIHCCGKCDWSIPIKVGVNIINFDAFMYSENLSLFHKELKGFLENGGLLAWGIVPTLDKEALANTDIEELSKILNSSITLLTNKGIDKNLILNNSMLTPSCGAGALTIPLAEKAMQLVKELSEHLKAGKF